jgi:hypothetical protein
VLLTALPCHFYLLEGRVDMTATFLSKGYLDLWMGAGIGVSLVIALIVTLVPMHLGLNAFRRMEV